MLKINETKKENAGARLRPCPNNGITLIALIITIIVMLILVAVTITVAVNGGLFNYAGRAGKEINEAIEKEQGLADGKVKVEDKWYASIDDYLAGKELIELPEGIKVGDYVNYTPDEETYTVASGSTGSGYGSEQSFTTETGESSLKWRILSINEETGEIEIVSAKAAQTSKKLYLSGADGYNHAVDILNDLCETLYSKTVNGKKVATGRSINVEDINAKTTYDYTTYSDYGTVYEPSSKQYPNLYATEVGSTANGLNETADLLEGSDRVEKGTKNESGVTEYSKYAGSSTASTLYTTRTDYYYTAEDYLNKDLGINTAPTGLINVYTSYWLASRCVGAGSDFTWFRVRIMYENGRVNNGSLFRSSGDYTGKTGYAVRPVVSLESYVSLTKDTTNPDENITYWNIEF